LKKWGILCRFQKQKGEPKKKDGFKLQDGKEGVVKVEIPDVWYTVELRGHFPNGLDISK